MRLVRITGLLGLICSLILSTCYFNVPHLVEASAEPGYYFVEMNEKPVNSYKGGIEGFEATAVNHETEKLDVQDKHVQKYRKFLASRGEQLRGWIDRNIGEGKVESEFSLTLNAIGVKATAAEAKRIANAPNVKRVIPAKTYKPAMNKSSSIINGGTTFSSRYKGSGVKVAVIDSGIDVDHPFLKDDSLVMPKGFPKVDNPDWEDLTSNKVIVAKIFHDSKKATPKALSSHGTHVAGTIAGVEGYKDPSGVVASPLSGVAPKAYLGNYNVFPCKEDQPCGASSMHIAAAVEAAVNDGMDVLNLSLGSESDTRAMDLLVEAVNGATRLGKTVVIAGGNEGPNPNTIGSPGMADSVITVGAVQNSHYIGGMMSVSVDDEVKDLPIGESSPGGNIKTEMEHLPIAVPDKDELLGCEDFSDDFKDKLLVVKRGTCTFEEKLSNAAKAHAKGLIVVNNQAGPPITMKVASKKIRIPMVMVDKESGAWILAGEESFATLTPNNRHEFKHAGVGEVTDFSSRGPTINCDLKPDVAAVGGDVYSSVPGGGLDSKSGTSMATPHVAGAAAVLLEAHPRWKPTDVKAALMATASDAAGRSLPIDVGAGVINISKALNPVALAYPSSLSFRQLSSSAIENKTMTLSITNSSPGTRSYTVSSEDSGLEFGETEFLLKKGETTEVEVSVSSRFRRMGFHQGYITLKSKSDSVRVPYLLKVTR